MIDWVDEVLCEWGRHVRGAVCRLGYPSMTIDARMQDGALSVAGLRSIPQTYFPESVELAEQVILRMPEDLVQVAIAVYTTPDDMTRPEQARLLGRRLDRNVSTKTLTVWINALHHRYEGYYRGVIDMLDEQKCLTVASHR